MTFDDDIAALTAELRKRAAAHSKLAKELDGTSDGAAHDPAAVARVLNTHQDPASEIDLLELVKHLREGSSEQARVQLLELEADLASICSDSGWAFDGQWPVYHVQRAIEVRVDEKTQRLLVAGEAQALISVRALRGKLAELVKALIPSDFSAERFLEHVRSAHRHEAPGGGQVSLLTIYRNLVVESQPRGFWKNPRAGRFRELTLEQFRARFTAMLESRVTRTKDGLDLVLLPPVDADDGVFMYQPAERRFGFVGRLEFRRS